MINMQKVSYSLTLPPQSINGTDTLSTAVDTLGYNYATFIFLYGASTADMEHLEIQECDTSGGSYAAITGSAVSVMPTSTDDNKLWVWQIQLGGSRKRYLKIRVDPGAAATLVAAVAELSRANQSPNTATEYGTAVAPIVL